MDNYKKLARCMNYVNGIKDEKLTLEILEDGVIKWWTDALFAVHPDC